MENGTRTPTKRKLTFIATVCRLVIVVRLLIKEGKKEYDLTQIVCF